MKSVAFFWGIAGVLLLLLFAVYRLAPMALELTERELTAGQWLVLGFRKHNINKIIVTSQSKASKTLEIYRL